MAGYLLTEHLYHSLTIHIGTAKAIFTETAILEGDEFVWANSTYPIEISR
jgi:hypothetical protein